MSLLGLNAALPIIPKNVNTIATQFCCIKIIKRTVKFLNPGQTPIDTCDQHVYALTKKIQWTFLEEVGPNSYYTLFDGLHFEQCIWLFMENQLKEVVYMKYNQWSFSYKHWCCC